MAFFPAVRLHIVSGKGGTGKTTVAGALAVGLAREGARVLLVEVEGRHGLAPMFGATGIGHAETRLARTAGGGEVLGLAVDPEQALIEYLELFYRLGRAGRLLRRMGAVDFVTTIAPGLRDVLLIGRVKEAAIRRAGAGHFYDAVVLDAPPTGRIVRFLGATDEVAQLATVGPIRTQSEAVMALLRSSQTAVHLVTLLEEMPVQETVDGITDLRRAGLPVGGIVAAKVAEPLLPEDTLARAADSALDLDALASSLAGAGLDVGPDVVKGLAEEAADHACQVSRERALRDVLAAERRPTRELPQLAGPVDLAGLHELAAALVEP